MAKDVITGFERKKIRDLHKLKYTETVVLYFQVMIFQKPDQIRIQFEEFNKKHHLVYFCKKLFFFLPL